MITNMNISKVDLKIEKIVFDGAGLGKLPSGKSVFIPFTLPGEVVCAQIIEEKKDYALARLIEILNPSPERCLPRCAHFGECGGCQLQHIKYDTQIGIKKGILSEQWQRIAKIQHLPDIETLPSVKAWNYRASLQFRLDEKGGLGFSRMKDGGVISIRECHLPCEDVAQIWPKLKFESGSHIQRVEVRAGYDGDVMVTLQGKSGQVPEIETDLPISIAFISSLGTSVLAGDDHILISVLDRKFRVSPGAFFQVNPSGAERIIQWVMQHAGSGHTVVDAYCGGGLFSAFLAPHFNRVVGIEAAPPACEDFVVNLDEYDNIELYQGAVEAVLPGLKIKPDLVLLDPPRSGLGLLVVESILSIAPERMIYISCDPATLARDARTLLAGGYRLQDCVLCDMFPQTYHIESINYFVKE